MDPLNPLHIDVLSLKGGAGKTTTSFLLARSLATDLEPVLLIDADLTGSCLGDLLYPNDQPGWPQRAGLAHLLCVHPETLNDRLKTRPPVYAAPAPIGGEVRLFSEQDVSGELLCPSHLYALAADGYDRVDSHLLTALAAHETAASWCSHVIDALTTHVRVTVAKSTTADGAPRKLKAVIVDHSPGIGAFQQRVLDETGHTMSVKLLVRTDDLVDRVMVDEFLAIIQGDASEKKSHSARKSPT